MEKYKVDFMEKKNEDWIIASLSSPEASFPEVSINRKNKKGEVFPNFDGIQAGREVEGHIWSSPAGKVYLFAPQPEGSKPPMRSAGAITKAMDRKEAGIEKFQDSKEQGIMTSSTIRMAVDITLAESAGLPFDVGVFKGRVKVWRDWLIAEWDNTKSAPPFN
jgi:hypothetical protein